MPVTPSKTSRTRKPSQRQQRTNENRTDNAAKKCQNKEKTQQAAAKKSKRDEKTVQAAALRDATNVSQAVETSPEEQTASPKAAKNKKETYSCGSPSDPSDDNSEIIPIPKPKGKFNIQEAMGLADDQCEFTKLQAGVHVLAVEVKIDFGEPWSKQEPSTVAKPLRVSEKHFPYLTSKQFPRYWATSAMLQRYINNVHGYQSGLKNPDSGVSRRCQRVTKVGQREVEAQHNPITSRLNEARLNTKKTAKENVVPPTFASP
ncbi:hypothetical protein B0H14DRAFT_3713934 [Mycena olivaceomarginata]|nr:hypothetical protein B0H14DRAFT_3713934 [Mycena olivaceomarginata]